MGASLSYVAIKGKERSEILSTIQMSPLPENIEGQLEVSGEETAIGELSGFTLIVDGSWQIFDEQNEALLSKLSENAELTYGMIEEHIMYSCVGCYKNGVKSWSIVSNSESDEIEIFGEPPEFCDRAIQEAKKLRKETPPPEQYDFEFEIAVDIFQELVGYSYCDDLRVETIQNFNYLESNIRVFVEKNKPIKLTAAKLEEPKPIHYFVFTVCVVSFCLLSSFLTLNSLLNSESWQSPLKQIFGYTSVCITTFFSIHFILAPFLMTLCLSEKRLSLLERFTALFPYKFKRGEILVYKLSAGIFPLPFVERPELERWLIGTYKVIEKKIVGEPGDKLDLKEGMLIINGKISDYSISDYHYDFEKFPFVVPVDHYFVAGEKWKAEDYNSSAIISRNNILGRTILHIPLKRSGF